MKHSFFKSATSTKWYPLPHPLYNEEKFVIDWSSIGSKMTSTRHQRQYLIKSCKELLVAILCEMKHKTARPTPHTIYNTFLRIRLLSDWMNEQEKWRFSELTYDDIYNFLATKAINKATKTPISEKTMSSRFSFLNRMWLLRDEYVGSLRIEPSLVQQEVKFTLQLQTDQKWKPLPDDIAMRLISNANWWIQEIGPTLLNINQQLWSIRPALKGLNKEKRTKLFKHKFDSLNGLSEIQTLRHALNDPISSPFVIIRNTYSLIKGACISCILFFIGLRVSELSSMNVGTLVKVGHDDGSEYDYVNGIGAKIQGKERSWIASSPVRAAIELLSDLYADLRHEKKINALLLVYNSNGTVLFPDRKAARMGSNTVAAYFRRFATFSLKGVRRSNVRIHPHTARKTFAKFVVRRDKTSLEALAHHFGHVHRLVTDHNYVGSDIELASFLDEENRAELASCLSQLLTSDSIGGKAGSAILEMRTTSKKFDFKGKHSLEAMVNSLISKGIQIAPCNWGYCVYSKALSACSGDDRGPNELQRSPTICGSCSNFAITEKHRAWWEDRIKEDEKFVSIEQVSPQSRMIVEKRLVLSTQLLRGLNAKRFEK